MTKKPHKKYKTRNEIMHALGLCPADDHKCVFKPDYDDVIQNILDIMKRGQLALLRKAEKRAGGDSAAYDDMRSGIHEHFKPIDKIEFEKSLKRGKDSPDMWQE